MSTIKITGLTSSGAIVGNVILPMVGNVAGTLTTLRGTVDQLKTFIVASAEANILAANSATIFANTVMKGYVDLANTIQSAQISTANIGIIGYVDLGNTIVTAGITSANLGMKGYVDSVASQSIYGNGNVTSYTVSMGFTNFSNVNVSALITTNGLTNYSNVNTKAYAESMGYQNYGNVNVAAVITTNGLTNYSNVNTAALITTNGLTNYSNVNLTAYLGGAVTIGGNLITGGARADTGYQFSKPTANVEVTANMSTTHLILAPTGTVISFGANVTLPGGNLDGRLFSITSNVATTLAVQASTGTSITPFGNVQLTAGTNAQYLYYTSDTKWYKIG